MSAPRPPALVRWILRRLCSADHLEVVEGDIGELYGTRVRSVGRYRATLRCLADVFSIVPTSYGRARIHRGRSRRPQTETGGASPRPPQSNRPPTPRTEALVDELLHDLKYALRGLSKSPAFAAVVVLTLGLGIGANTTIFSIVNGVLLQPLPYFEPDRIVQVGQIDPDSESEGPRMASQNLFLAWRDNAATLASLAMYSNQSATLTGIEEPQRLTGVSVSPSLFGLLGTNAIHGRTFTVEEEVPGNDAVIILSSRTWQRYFGGNPAVVGQQIRLDERPRTVVGIMPPDFQFPEPDTEFWVPMIVQPFGAEASDSLAAAGGRMVREEVRRPDGPEGPEPAGGPGGPDGPPAGGGAAPGPGPDAPHVELWGQVVGRLADGVEIGAAAEEGTATVRGLREVDPARAEQPSVELALLQDELVGPVRSSLTLLMGAVGFVLLIACANVANLMMARSAGRARETAVRSALGAGKLQLVRMLLVEGLVLAGIGGMLGILLTFAGLRLLQSTGPDFIPRLQNAGFDANTLAFTVLITAGTGLLFSLMPARGATGLDLTRALKEEGPSGSNVLGRDAFRKLLVAAELALSVILLVGAGLLVSSFVRLASVDPGYDPDNVLTVTMQMPQTRYSSPEAYLTYFEESVAALEQIPGVESATLASRPPTAEPNIRIGLSRGDEPDQPDAQSIAFGIRVVEPSYFDTLGVRFVAGRSFDANDRVGGAPVAIVNESAAQTIFPEEEALGRSFAFMGPNELEIIGIVADARTAGVDPSAGPEVFIPIGQAPARMVPGLFRSALFMIRTDPAPLSLLPDVRSRMAQIDAEVPLFRASTLRDQISQSVAEPRFYAALVSAFAALAIVLAAVGIYGLLSYSVQQSIRETAIRRALGARGGEILGRVLRQGMTLAVVGLTVGIAGAMALTRLLESMLYEIEPTDPITLAAAAIVFLLVALAAIWLPARRATRVDPMEALRYEG